MVVQKDKDIVKIEKKLEDVEDDKEFYEDDIEEQKRQIAGLKEALEKKGKENTEIQERQKNTICMVSKAEAERQEERENNERLSLVVDE